MTLNNRQLLIDYIINSSNEAVKEFDYENKKIKYSDEIKSARKIKDITGDEELVRAYLITKLVDELGYPVDRIEIEKEYKAGRPHTITSRIDIVVKDINDNAFLFIETKTPNEFRTLDKDQMVEDQLYKLSSMEEAEGNSVKYLILYTTNSDHEKIADECIVIDKEKVKTFNEWEIKRESVNAIPENYGIAQKTPYIKGSKKDLEVDFDHQYLDRLRKDLHNVLWGGGGTDDNEVFSSLTNLILAKIQDEDEKDDNDIYDFQSLTFVKEGDEQFESDQDLFDRINGLYRRALVQKLYIIDENEINKSYVIDTKKFSLSKLKYTVQKFESISFVDGKNSLNGKDILGDFFEGIIRTGFKQSKGQFFTHINIVKFMLWGLQTDKLGIYRIKQDKEIPYFIDPSAGSGTFLIEYMKFITNNMKYRFRDELGNSRGVNDKVNSDWFYPANRENKWAQTFIYGAEINFNLGIAAKVNMILHGDGSTNIFVKDGLLPFDRYEKETAPNAMQNIDKDKYYFDKDVNKKFDVILTNPPFNVQLDNDTKRLLTKEFIFGNKKNSENLFVERWYQLLRENGRFAAILPESIFDTSENKYIRLFIYKYFKVKSVVSLPQIAFEPYTSTKTSIIFAQKKTAEEISLWNEQWDYYSKEYSKLSRRVKNIIDVLKGKKIKERNPSIKNLTEDEEKEILLSLLFNSVIEEDKTLSLEELIVKYDYELGEVLKIDNSLVDVFGRVNLWWVFSKVSEVENNNILMIDVNKVGYKRTLRGETITENELYRVDQTGEVIINDGIKETALDYLRELTWD